MLLVELCDDDLVRVLVVGVPDHAKLAKLILRREPSGVQSQGDTGAGTARTFRSRQSLYSETPVMRTKCPPVPLRLRVIRREWMLR